MATHGCIGNPCWICYPQYAPKQEPYQAFKTISGITKELLLAVFDQGLDEDTHFREMVDGVSIEELQEERKHIDDNSMEAVLLDKLIEDYLNKRHHYDV